MENSTIVDHVLEKLVFVNRQFYRLLLIVGPSERSRENIVNQVSEKINAPVVNISLDVSRQLMELPEKQRPLKLTKILDSIRGWHPQPIHGQPDAVLSGTSSQRGRRPHPIHGKPDAALSGASSQKLDEKTRLQMILGKDTFIFKNIELLFHAALKTDPMRLFKNISRNKTLIVAWNGVIKDNYLIYAAPGHPDYKKYPTNDLNFINLHDSS